jgi:hypothetical protein
MGGTLRIRNSEYEVHQVGPKDYGSQNFSFLAFIGTELVSRQITATATARDRRIFFKKDADTSTALWLTDVF